MFQQAGILGTKAALYMDLATIYFAILPFLVFYSITFAIRKMYKKHYQSQIFILFITIIMVLVFEVGVRLSGGYFEFIQHSSISPTFMSWFLSIHIIIALVTVLSWIYLIIKSLKDYLRDGVEAKFFKKHKIFARSVFVGIAITSFMGCSVYIFLFVW
ncbi:MAG: DUF420 domain-containing protein [Thiovulaceae bacterium]|nr:DUF420 domain-containing protein [Sulfurimonadaceae bacterium]